MLTKVVFLLSFIAGASSQLICDPEPPSLRTPTPCSNYKKLSKVIVSQKNFSKQQIKLEQRIDAMESRTQDFESTDSKIMALKTLANKLPSALKDLERMKKQNEKEFKEAKRQLAKHEVDIASLKTQVEKLVEHRERIRGNFKEIEKKLHTTEKELREKKVRLENLEIATKGALNDTQRLIGQYKYELCKLNTTTQTLEVKVEARLHATKTDLEAKLKKIKSDNEGLNAKWNEQKAEVDKFKNGTQSKFSNFDKQLKAEKSTVDKQRADIDILKSDTTGIKKRLKSTEKKVSDQSKLKLEVNRISAEVNAKVAFSATVTASSSVFTGPAITRNILIFNRVFTNIGKAYNPKTGIFTAPLKGVYQFSFMTFGYNSHTSGAILVKNEVLQVSTWEFKGPDISDTTSNTVILELKAKETVNIILWKGGKVHQSVFTGFLIFPTA